MKLRIKELRTERGLTLVELGKLALMSDATVSRIETHKDVRTLDRLERLARALNVPFWAIFDLPEADVKRLQLLGLLAQVAPSDLPSVRKVLEAFAQPHPPDSGEQP